MAGIGFELKKLFAEKGLLLQIRANIYATLVITGPMILGVLLLLGVKVISGFAGATTHEQDLIIVIITYALLFSLLLTSLVLFVLARFIADMIFADETGRILPSMYGAISILLVIGAIGWGLYLSRSQLPFIYSIYAFILFCEGIVIWVQINYITAVKDYRSIFIGLLVGIIIGLLFGYLFTRLNYDLVASMLAGASITYGIVLLTFTVILHRYFPLGSGTSFKFLEWIDDHPQLVFIGFFTTLGLFAHIILMWFSPWGVRVHGSLFFAPAHDIPALLAFLTGLVTTVNFVTSVEVNFYSKYRTYFSLLNEDGSLGNIEKAYDEMMTVLKQELFYLALQQIFVTFIAIVVVGELLVNLGLGFTSVMIGLFRILCVGYGLFAIGNSLMLFLLYFVSYKDALITTAAFVIVNIVGTIYTISLPPIYYGFGFVAAGLALYLVALVRLNAYTKRIDYYIFSKQPVFFIEKKGLFSRISSRLNLQ